MSVTLKAQDMSSGFALLETGNYKAAQFFFENILKDHPENKTARLCYGRAVGLNGNSKEAKSLFTALKTAYPNDFEVGLNYAEALLWDQDYSSAKMAYQELLVQDSTNFSALLGYANTLSNLKEYDLAINYVTRALKVKPANANAMTSKKFMFLGKASQLASKEDYDPAIKLLRSLLLTTPSDQDLKAALANIYIAQKDFSKARETFSTLTDSLNSFVGLSLVAHLQKNDSQALNFAEKGLAFAKADTTQYLLAQERYIQALIWKGKYRQAQKAIAALSEVFPDNSRIAALKATLGMYTGRFTKSIAVYQSILKQDSTSFDGNLGIANAYRAQGNLKLAKAYARKTLVFYPNQKDAKSLLQTLNKEMAPVIETLGAFTSDNGDNQAYSSGLRAHISISDRFKSSFSYQYRTTENKTTNTMAYNTSASLGAQYRLVNNTWVAGNLGFIKANAVSNDYTDLNGSLFVKSRPLPLQYLELGYSRSLQDFNAALVDKKIFMNNYTLNYNMGTNINLGWYTGLMHTQQTDGNTRNLLFSSLYYTFTKSPGLKGGINFQYLSFKNQVPTLYFSPSRYRATEVFLDLTGQTGSWSYSANAAAGLQMVEREKATTLFRLEAKVHCAISERFVLGGYGKYSNIASATAVGFEFMEVGLTLRWQLKKTALFSLD
jgi:tetratricopeptide (TPR) repeat protein